MYKKTEGVKLLPDLDLMGTGFTERELTDVFYSLTGDPSQENLILESASFEEIDGYYNPFLGDDDMALESIYVPKYGEMERYMEILRKVLDRGFREYNSTRDDGEQIHCLTPIIGKVKKNAMVATVTVQFPFTDGQVVSVIFHSPEDDRRKITPQDSLMSFRWLLNKRDITQAVSPEQGKEITFKVIGKRVSQLVAKNSEKFVTRNAQRAKMQAELNEISEQAVAEEERHDTLLTDVAAAEKEEQSLDAKLNNIRAKITSTRKIKTRLKNKIEVLKKSRKERADTPESQSLRRALAGQNTMEDVDWIMEQIEKFGGFNEFAEKYPDFADKIISGWVGAVYMALKNDFDFTAVNNAWPLEKNGVAVSLVSTPGMPEYNVGGTIVTQTLSETPEEFAGRIDALVQGGNQGGEDWHTMDIPGKGLDVIDGESIDDTLTRIIDDAMSAITDIQKTGGEALYSHYLSATDSEHGIVRFFPDDQEPPSGWIILNSEKIRANMVDEGEIRAQLRELLRSAHVISSGTGNRENKNKDTVILDTMKSDDGQVEIIIMHNRHEGYFSAVMKDIDSGESIISKRHTEEGWIRDFAREEFDKYNKSNPGSDSEESIDAILGEMSDSEKEALRDYEEGTKDGMKKPITMTYNIKGMSDYFYLNLKKQATIQDKYEYLKEKFDPETMTMRVGDGDGGDFNDSMAIVRAKNDGAEFSHFKIEPKEDHVLVEMTIDLEGTTETQSEEDREVYRLLDELESIIAGNEEGRPDYIAEKISEVEKALREKGVLDQYRDEIEAAESVLEEETEKFEKGQHGSSETNSSVTFLNEILEGKHDADQDLADKLESALDDLEESGLIDQYEDLLNQAIDYNTDLLEKMVA